MPIRVAMLFMASLVDKGDVIDSAPVAEATPL
jgi:hypothetical protein